MWSMNTPKLIFIHFTFVVVEEESLGNRRRLWKEISCMFVREQLSFMSRLFGTCQVKTLVCDMIIMLKV